MFAFLHSKTAISFNILLVLQILCRYACRLTCIATNFQMYRQNSEKALLGGLPPCPPPPPVTLMAGNAKEADIWFGRESAREARGKFKDLVCLVVFLCWIKRFVLLSLCLKCKYMNRYFSSFQKSSGGGGDDPPPPSPPDRRLCHGRLFPDPIILRSSVPKIRQKFENECISRNWHIEPKLLNQI